MANELFQGGQQPPQYQVAEGVEEVELLLCQMHHVYLTPREYIP